VSGPLTRWRARCQAANDANDDAQYGAGLARDRTKACFKASHALEVLLHTPPEKVDYIQRDGFDQAIEWLREEMATPTREADGK